MKNLKQLSLLIMLLFSAATFSHAQTAVGLKAKAERQEVNTEKSTIDWRGEKVTGKHNGTINLQEGYLMMANETLMGGSFTVDMNSIENLDINDDGSRGKLVGHLKSEDFFYVEKHPKATFIILDVKENGNGSYDVTGNMTIRGKINKVTFPAKVETSEGQTTATAEITIDRSLYDVKYGSGSFFDGLGDKMIHDDFELTVKLVTNESGL
ncbi:MAG: YceI family protein [Bacteroidia bacterium]